MPKAKDYTGVRFGRIVGLRPTEKRRNKQIVWVWKCDCGDEFEQVAGNFSFSGHSGGCPECVKKASVDTASRINKTHGVPKSAWCRLF